MRGARFPRGGGRGAGRGGRGNLTYKLYDRNGQIVHCHICGQNHFWKKCPNLPEIQQIYGGTKHAQRERANAYHAGFGSVHDEPGDERNDQTNDGA
eukprot:3311413-Rhodomonas_salina.1